jgi:hypothetical protein
MTHFIDKMRVKALIHSQSRTSKAIEHLHSIYVSTFGVVFLGTPHDGSSLAGLAALGRRMLDALVPSRLWDTDGQLVEALREGSEELKNITDLFTPMMKNFRLYFFWEQEKTSLGHTTDYVSDTVRPEFPEECRQGHEILADKS